VQALLVSHQQGVRRADRSGRNAGCRHAAAVATYDLKELEHVRGLSWPLCEVLHAGRKHLGRCANMTQTLPLDAWCWSALVCLGHAHRGVGVWTRRAQLSRAHSD
jgi:hypothetical protein